MILPINRAWTNHASSIFRGFGASGTISAESAMEMGIGTGGSGAGATNEDEGGNATPVEGGNAAVNLGDQGDTQLPVAGAGDGGVGTVKGEGPVLATSPEAGEDAVDDLGDQGETHTPGPSVKISGPETELFSAPDYGPPHDRISALPPQLPVGHGVLRHTSARWAEQVNSLVYRKN